MSVYPPNAHIDPLPFFSQPDACQEKLFQYRMLASPLRKYVIEKIKDPLRLAIERAGSFWSLVILMLIILRSANRIRNKVGKVTKENSVYISTHRLLEHKEEFMRHHKKSGRHRLIEAAYDIIAAINEHDSYYQFILGEEAEMIANDFLIGKWVRDTRIPRDLKPHWNTDLS